MQNYCKVIKRQGRLVTVELDDMSYEQLTKLDKLIAVQSKAELNVEDGRTITIDQRRKIYALIRDVANWSGESVNDLKAIFKGYTEHIFELKPYSFSDCSITVASNTIYTILEFCFRFDVPFKTRTWDLLPSDYALQKYCLRFRRCVICGKHADIAHVEAVGSGRNRHKISHADFDFMALCRNHHMEQHNIGIKTFLKKYHIKPIRLDKEERVRLGLEAKGTQDNDQQNNFNRTSY